jgi:gamma-glutamyltranspeptidase / glutathione hydrolase
MGGDAQPQIHLQLLHRLVDRGATIGEAVAAPRFVVDVADGSVAIESRASAGCVPGAHRPRARRRAAAAYDDRAGHSHVIEVTPHGYAATSDPRCDGAAVGW